MNYYEKNIDYMKINNTYFYKKLSAVDNASINPKLENVQSIDARNGDKIVLIKYESKEYRLNSLYNPTEEAVRWAQQFDLQNPNTVITMFGFGNGMFTRALIERMDENGILIIYEPSFEIFHHVIENFDITDILGNRKVFVAVRGVNDFEFHNVLMHAINLSNLKFQQQCIYPNYDNIFAESCVEFFQELKNSLKTAVIRVNTTIKLHEKHIENTMKNVEFFKNSTTTAELKKYIPEEVPAIVVAAGPSVGENIEYIKRAKGKAVIFAVDRVFDYLLEQGVEPDFVVTLDPQKDLKYFTERENVTTPLICDSESNYKILEHHKGKKIFFTSNPFIKEVYRITDKTVPFILSGGSVAVSAFNTCIYLGFKRIILVGQDLAFKDGASHAGGQSDNLPEGANLYVEGVDGTQVKSRYDWKEFITQFQDIITINPLIEVIDAKLSGAKIKGTINMTLEEALDKYCENAYRNNLVKGLQEELFSDEDINKIKKYFEDNLLIIKKIKDKAENALKECNILIKENSRKQQTHKMDGALKKLGKINKFIEEQKIYTVIDTYITAKTAQHLAEMAAYTDDEDANNLSTFEKSKAIYQAAVDAVDFIKTIMESVIAKL